MAVFLGGQIHIIWICLRNLSMNLQNVPCVANQQLSDAQDVKLSGTVKGIKYFLNYACGTKFIVLFVGSLVALGHDG